MKSKKVKLPTELQTFVDSGNSTFHCDDGDWDLRIVAGKESPFRDYLPVRSILIAENGCGDCLFLKTSATGKIDPKVFVFWHEEERHEVFAKKLEEVLVAQPVSSSKGEPKAAAPTMSVAELESAMGSADQRIRDDAIARFEKTKFGVDALPVLRQALADESITVMSCAIRCIGKLGPKAMASPAAEERIPPYNVDLEFQLVLTGSRVFSYSLYPNCYSACLDTLRKIQVEPEAILEYVVSHIGLSCPDDLMASLNALKDIGTPEALDILKRAVTFWLPDLNMKYAKIAKELVSTARVQKARR